MTRKKALAKGLLLYTSGKKCSKHPNSARRVSNGNCHECICERMKSPHSRRLMKERRARQLAAKRADKKAPGTVARGKGAARRTRGGMNANGS